MKKYIILIILFLLAATATVIAGRKSRSNNFQYSALGKTFQCSPKKGEQRWICTSPEEPKKGNFTAIIWNISQQEPAQTTPSPTNSAKPWLIEGEILTSLKAGKRVIDTFTNLFGNSIQEETLFCPQKNTIAGYAIAKTSKIKSYDKGKVFEEEFSVPAAEVFYKATPEKAVFILHQFDPVLRNDMLHRPEEITLENLQSLWNQQILSKLCDLP